MSIALATIITNAKGLVDEENADFVTTANWQRHVDNAIEELWRKFMTLCPDAITLAVDFTGSSYALTTTRGVRYMLQDPTSQYPTVIPMVPAVGAARYTLGYYRIGNTIYLASGRTGNFRLFVFDTPKLNSASDTNLSPVLEPWAEYIEVRAAIKAAAKDEAARPDLYQRLGEINSELQEVLSRQSATPIATIESADEDPLGHWF